MLCFPNDLAVFRNYPLEYYSTENCHHQMGSVSSNKTLRIFFALSKMTSKKRVVGELMKFLEN